MVCKAVDMAKDQAYMVGETSKGRIHIEAGRRGGRREGRIRSACSLEMGFSYSDRASTGTKSLVYLSNELACSIYK